MDWEQLIAVAARYSEVPTSSIHGDTLLIEGLGLDSLALTEMLITIIEEFEIRSLEEALFSRSWEGVTLAQLYDLYCAPQPLAGAAPGSDSDSSP